jgi:hypothetical protein
MTRQGPARAADRPLPVRQARTGMIMMTVFDRN